MNKSIKSIPDWVARCFLTMKATRETLDQEIAVKQNELDDLRRREQSLDTTADSYWKEFALLQGQYSHVQARIIELQAREVKLQHNVKQEGTRL